MRNVRIEPPVVQQTLVRLFVRYAEWYLSRNFHSIRLAGSLRGLSDNSPVIVVMNHPSWWDPLIALTLAYRLLPDRSHFGAMDAPALQKYPFLGKVGLFGIEPGTAAGAARFLRMGEAVLSKSGSVLWVTAQGRFSDPRVRPVELRSGVGHLLRRMRDVTVLPLAMEYPFWEEKYPEALVRIGDCIRVENGTALSTAEWTGFVADRLEAVQDLLAADSTARNGAAFQVLTAGRAGVGGTYDLWRAVRAAWRGEKFRRAHGSEHF